MSTNLSKLFLDGGEPHSAFDYRRHCSRHGALRPSPVLAAAPLIA
jgi:hypothetical protein